MVVYQALYGDYGLWIRPKDMFEEKISCEGKQCHRFEYVSSVGEEAPTLR